MIIKSTTFSVSFFKIYSFAEWFHESFPIVIFSASVSSQSNGLESLGLADIRILVRLMTLAAGGRAHTCVDGRSSMRGLATDGSNSTCLTFLTSAIGSVVSHSPTAYRELVEICTQVSFLLSVC